MVQQGNSLQDKFPDIAAQWHPSLNGDLKPTDVSVGSNKLVWWLCPISGGEWKTSPNKRTRKGKDSSAASPFQLGLRVKIGYNDLAITHPDLSQEWDDEKNGDLTPTMVTAGSEKKVWWICPETGGSYEAVVNKRVSGTGSPFLAGKKVLKGYNDLLSQQPELAQYFSENNSEKADEVFVGTTKKYLWVCPTYNIEYEDSVRNRVKNTTSPGKSVTNSPFTTGQRVIPHINSVQAVHPEMTKQWDYDKNDLKPDEVFAQSNKKFWWKCDVTQKSWSATPSSRGRSSSLLSPFVANRELVKNFNDLGTLFPEIAKSWHPTKNGDLSPSDVIPGSHKKVWWLCSESGYPWESEIKSRVSQGVGSPYQSGKKVAPGYNDIASTHKELCKQWNYKKNGDLTPEMFTAGTNTRVWWVCEENHEWLASISNRTRSSGATNCPVCSLSGTSNKEKELFNYICSVAPVPCEVISNDRSVLSNNRGKLGGTEIDILIPALNLGFEFNGHYWHDESEDFADTGIGKPIGYHAAKTKSAEQNGVKLIHVWESEWDMNNDVVKEKVKNFITLAVNKNIYGEK